MKKFFVFLFATLIFLLSASVNSNAQQSSLVDERGVVWQKFTVNDIDVYLNLSKVRKLGRYVMLSVKIVNRSEEGVAYDFYNTTVENGSKTYKFYTRNEFERRLENRARWNSFGADVASIATATALDAAFHTTAIGKRHHGFGKELLRGLTRGVILSGAMAGSVIVDQVQQNAIANIIDEDIEYLNNVVIQPNHAINGFAYARFNPSNSVSTIFLPLGGKVFAINVNPDSLNSIELGNEE